MPDPRPWNPLRAIITGALLVGTFDALDAIVFFGLRSHTKPIRIFQSIASGLLGKASFSGGMHSAALGVAIHYIIALSIASVFIGASRLVPALARHAVPFGFAYGLGVFAFMNLVVIPLSASTRGTMPIPVLANGIVIHLFGVGLPSALCARRATMIIPPTAYGGTSTGGPAGRGP